MKRYDLRPSKEKHSNLTLLGDGSKVDDMHVTKVLYSDGVLSLISTWRVPFWRRLKFLFDGRIQVAVLSEKHPPISVMIGDYD
jgi:hypothetical protein